MIADCIFINKLSYLISVWGGCEGYLARSLQIIQNKVARLVTNKPWSTPVKNLLAECGWLSVRQLAMYHTVLKLHQLHVQHRLQAHDKAGFTGCDQTKFNEKCTKT